jgi:tetratricopeptide (TPR) repeat protein
VRRRLLALALAAGCAAWRALPAAADSYLAEYESGHRALRYSSWDEAAYWFGQALERRAEDGGPPARISGRNYQPYLPQYYLGLALFQAGRYSEALKAWEVAEARWRTEPALARSPNLQPYRASIDGYRAHYRAALLPGAGRRLDVYLARLAAVTGRLQGQPASRALPEGPAELAAAEARLPRWRELAAAAARDDDYDRILQLTREVVEALDRLELLEACAGTDSVQPWCRRPRLPAPGPAVLRGGPALEPALAAAAPPGDAGETGLVLRPQDRQVIAKLYGRKCALLVSPRYSAWPAIRSADAKLRDLAIALRGLGFDEVTLLEGELSADKMQTEIQSFFRRNAPLDTGPNLLLVHFVGHGYSIDVRGRRVGLLLTSKTPPQSAGDHEISHEAIYETFFNQFRGIPLHHIVFSFETCSSGRFIEELFPPLPKDWRKSARNPAFLVVTAGDFDEVDSVDLPLTDELTRALKGCGQGAPEFLDGYTLLSGVQARVHRRYPSRHPQFVKYLLDEYRDGDVLLRIPNRCTSA